MARERVDFNAFRSQVMVFASDPSALDDVWWGPSVLYLYGDSAVSRVDYFERLEKLLGRSIKLHEHAVKASSS